MNKIAIPLVVISIFVVALILDNIYQFVGRAINGFFPCVQDPANSFPCFGIYDIYFMVILVLVIIVALIFIAVRLYQNRK